MSDTAQVVAARLHDGTRPVSRHVELALGESELSLENEAFALAELRVSPRTGRADRFVSLPDGRELQVADAAWLERLTSTEQSAPAVAWLEQRTWVAASSLLGMAAFSFWFWTLGLPWLALQAARYIPYDLERPLGEQSVEHFERMGAFAVSELASDTQAGLRSRFESLVATLPKDEYRYELRLYSAGVGPNAYAFPGGIIVVTDDLVDLCPLDEVTAVMAHELSHARNRHVMQGVLADAGLAAVLKALFGDVTGSGALEAPELLLSLGYSRALEEQADDGAFELLRRVRLRPALLGDALERLEQVDKLGWREDDETEDGSEPFGAGASGSAGAEGGADDAGAAATAVSAPETNPETPPERWVENWVEVEPAAASPQQASAGAANSDDIAPRPAVVVHEPEHEDDFNHGSPDELPDWMRDETSWSFLLSHPVTAERIARARAAH